MSRWSTFAWNRHSSSDDPRPPRGRIAAAPCVTRRRLAAALALTPWFTAHAAPGGLPSFDHADSTPEWEKLRDTLFPGRRIVFQGGVVKLVVPLRAAYGASVPVKIEALVPQRPERHIRHLTLLVDKNPSPVAARITLSPELGSASLETRLRVDEYSHIRVVAELNDGTLHTDSRYVKVSGGCSAPPNRDLVALMGKTVLKAPEGFHSGRATPLDVQVLHPNDTGFELNQVTVMYIPPHFVRQLRVSIDGRTLWDAELDFSISENPSFRLFFAPGGPGLLRADVEDTKDQRFTGTLPVVLGG